MRYIIPLVDGVYTEGDASITTEGTRNESFSHKIIVALNGAPSDGKLTIQYKRAGSNRWDYVDYTNLSEVEPQKIEISGVSSQFRFIVEGASGTGTAIISDTELGESITPYGLFGETNGMTPEEIGGALSITNLRNPSKISQGAPVAPLSYAYTAGDSVYFRSLTSANDNQDSYIISINGSTSSIDGAARVAGYENGQDLTVKIATVKNGIESSFSDVGRFEIIKTDDFTNVDLIEDFSDASAWTANVGFVSDSTDAILNGNSLLVANAGSGVNTQKDTPTAIDASNMGVIAYRVKLDDDVDYQTLGTARIRLVLDGSSFYDVQKWINKNNDYYGEQWIAINSSDIPGFTELGNIDVYIRYQASVFAPRCDTSKVDALMANAGGKPSIMLTFDDVLNTGYSFVLPELQKRGLVGTWYVSPGRVGEETAMTWDQLKEISDSGSALSLDGTFDGEPMINHSTLSAAIADYEKSRLQMIAKDFPVKDLDHFCYPNGLTGDDGSRVIISGVSNSTTTLTLTSTTGLTAGLKVVGVGVPKITRIVSVDNATTLTVDNSIPTYSGDFMFVDDSGEFHGRKLQDALDAIGVKTGRTTIAGDYYSRFGIASGQRLKLPGNSSSNKTANDMISVIDEAISNGSDSILYFHAIVPSIASGTDMLETEFAAMLDYIKAKVDAGDIDCLTMQQAWEKSGETRVIG